VKGLLILILDILSIIGLTVAAYMQRGFYTIGGEVVLITAILCGSLMLLESRQSARKPARVWLTIES